MSKQLEQLKLRKEQIESRIQDINSREKIKKRKEETRVKILVGAMIVKTLKANKFMYLDIVDIIFENMHNNRDKEFLNKWFDKNT